MHVIHTCIGEKFQDCCGPLLRDVFATLDEEFEFLSNASFIDVPIDDEEVAEIQKEAEIRTAVSLPPGDFPIHYSEGTHESS